MSVGELAISLKFEGYEKLKEQLNDIEEQLKRILLQLENITQFPNIMADVHVTRSENIVQLASEFKRLAAKLSENKEVD